MSVIAASLASRAGICLAVALAVLAPACQVVPTAKVPDYTQTPAPAVDSHEAGERLRHARWLVEQALPDKDIAYSKQMTDALKQVRQTLGEIGGDYHPGDEARFTDPCRK